MNTTKSESDTITVDKDGNVVMNGGKVTIKKNGEVVVKVKETDGKTESTGNSGRQILHG